jgi:hypothetical protein
LGLAFALDLGLALDAVLGFDLRGVFLALEAGFAFALGLVVFAFFEVPLVVLLDLSLAFVFFVDFGGTTIRLDILHSIVGLGPHKPSD